MAKTIHGYLASANISVAGEILLYDENGATVTLGATDRLEIHSVGAASTTEGAGTVAITVFADANDDNVADAAEVAAVIHCCKGLVEFSSQVMGTPFLCQPGAKPHAIGSVAGTASITLTGVIRSY